MLKQKICIAMIDYLFAGYAWPVDGAILSRQPRSLRAVTIGTFQTLQTLAMGR